MSIQSGTSGWRGVAQARHLPVYEAPVGFNYLGELINEDKSILGDEESAGLPIKGHYPKKDGILACLLAAEAVAARGASLTEQLDDLYASMGRLENARIGVRITPQLTSLNDRLDRDQSDIGGGASSAQTAWTVLSSFSRTVPGWMRPSGTEPLVRIYAESESAKDLEVLLEQGRKYLLG
jgi:phosphoglucomutase